MQFQSDILDVSVHQPEILETTALGAAYLAGLDTGYWTENDLADQWQLKNEFLPGMDEQKRTQLISAWHKAVDRTKGWVDS
jgi:glycerol kinase